MTAPTHRPDEGHDEERLEKFKAVWDRYRDRMVELGKFWFMSETVNLGNLCGHILPKLRYMVSKEGEIEVSGYVIETNPKKEGHTMMSDYFYRTKS